MTDQHASRKALPKQHYRTVEWHLHNRATLYETIRNGRRTILDGGSSHDNGVPSGHSKHSDPTAVKGILLSDGTREMQRATRWIAAIRDTEKYFSGGPEVLLLTHFYGGNIKVPEFMRKHGMTKTKFYDLRDRIVNHLAMQAIGRGLIRMDRT